MGPRTLRCLAIVAAVLTAPLAVSSNAEAQPQPTHTVLTIHWSAEDFPSTPVVDGAIKNALRSGTAGPIDYFTEYLESDRFPTPEASSAFADYIQRKYRGRHIDVVIAVSDAALEFVLQRRNELFPDAPIVASVATLPDARIRSAGAGVTGVLGAIAYDKTLELLLQMHPSVQRVLVVAYAPTLELAKIVQTELSRFSPRVELTYVDEPSVERVLAAVRAVPAESAILFIRHSQEEHGPVLFPSDVARMVTAAASVPVYGANDSYTGTGVVGGVVASREQIGARLGEMVQQILGGVRAQDIPMEPLPLTPTIDVRQLARWGLDESRLPAGTKLLFRETTVWERYRGYILGASALILLQSGLIGGLLVQRARRRRAEALLRESEEHFRIMADTAPVLIWRSGIDKRFDFFNRPWLTFTGRALAQELDDGWAESVHPDDRASCLETYRRSFDARDPFRMEFRLRRADGEYRVMLDTGVPRWEADGVFAGYIGSCLDITDRKRAEQALQETHAELNRVSRLTALGEFAASIAHEVRQPLTAILVNAKTCLRGIARTDPDLDDVKEALLDLLAAGHRAEEVIKRNRELFRHQKMEAVRLDVNEVIRETTALVSSRLRESHVTLATSLPDGLPAVDGDRIELQQVLVNLISNAIDAMELVPPESRRIDISSALTSEPFVQVTVTDQGAGLAGVDTKRMFMLSYTTKPTGTGVGLSVSRAIVEAHGGRLWAEPNTGRGATFCFTIPVCSTVAVA